MMGEDGRGPVAEKRRRESNASLFILVQVQAGPPAFAREASARLPAEAFGEGGLVTASYGWQATFALTGYAQPRRTGGAKRVRRSLSQAKA
jgi:hypothetical protein